MIDKEILETIADIAYIFGTQGYFSGDSRADMLEIIHFAQEFEKQNHNWEEEDYLILINEYSNIKLEELRSLNQMAE